jgi:YHS domain-containing protein
MTVSGLMRLLFFTVIFWLVISGIKRLFLPPTASPRQPRRRGNEQEGLLMVKDPACGRFVMEGEAVRASVDGQTFHFCSLECRDRYAKSERGRG